jgi:hypothetical protein
MESEIQFDQVQRPAGGAACTSCRSALLGNYFQVNGRVFCQPCAEGVRKFFEGKEGGFGRFLKAAVFGVGGGIAGGAVYAIVLGLVHINAALITILIGWLVGKGVRKGSGQRGGVGYQILALILTYMSIGLFAMLSEVFSGGLENQGVLGIFFFCAFGAIAGPVTMAMSSPLSGLITFFGLMQAWRLNTAVQVAITGPHALASDAAQHPAPSDPSSFAPPAVPPTLPSPEPTAAPSA